MCIVWRCNRDGLSGVSFSVCFVTEQIILDFFMPALDCCDCLVFVLFVHCANEASHRKTKSFEIELN